MKARNGNYYCVVLARFFKIFFADIIFIFPSESESTKDWFKSAFFFVNSNKAFSIPSKNLLDNSLLFIGFIL
ncbi:MAG: hypothetical protein EAZ26_05525, partial [Runella slithyformis]